MHYLHVTQQKITQQQQQQNKELRYHIVTAQQKLSTVCFTIYGHSKRDDDSNNNVTNLHI